MLEPFVINAILAGVGIAIALGILGCFVIWRKMAYFGDCLAHSSLLGVALGLLYSIDSSISIILICILFASILVFLENSNILATDSLLGVLAHSSLSIGVIVIGILQKQQVDLHSYLFGDILTINSKNLFTIYFGCLIISILIFFNWRKLSIITICQDLAKSCKINILSMKLLLMFLMSLAVAISINIVGILLITSMLIIPASAARQFAKSPEKMVLFSIFFGIISVVSGIAISYNFDILTGPSIVVISVIIFILSFTFRAISKK